MEKKESDVKELHFLGSREKKVEGEEEEEDKIQPT